jgi:PAS domain S-box-containing protein
MGNQELAAQMTDRYHTEKALRDSEERFRKIFEEGPLGMAIVGLDYRFINVNSALCQMLGYSEQELTALTFPEITHSEDIEKDIKLSESVFSGKIPHFHLEKRYIKKNGEILWTNLTASVIRDEDGKPIYSLAMIEDITKRKRVEEQLQEQTSQLNLANQQISALHAVTVAASQSLELDTALQTVIKEITEIFHFDGTGIVLFDALRDELHLAISLGTYPEYWGRVRAFRRGQGIFGRVAETGVHMIFENIQSDPRYQELSHSKAAREAGCSFFAVFSIKSKSKIVGTIVCIGRMPRCLTHDEVQLVTSMANQIGIAVENAQLYEATKRQALQLEKDITERERAEEQLKRSREQLRNLARHLESVREAERAMIAREIHDELGQMLTGLKIDLAWLHSRLSEDQASVLDRTEAMSKLIDTTMKTVRRISSSLRPAILDDFGLVAAIKWQAEEFETRTGIQCRLTLPPHDITLDRRGSTSIFRVFQETLTNVARHANATEVNITLRTAAGNLILEITDNGKGITESEIYDFRSLGLLGMRERVLLLGGEFNIRGVKGKGTTLTVRAPSRKS